MTSIDRQLKSAEPLIAGVRSGSGWLAVGLVLVVWSAILISFRAHVAMVLEAWETLPSHAHGYVVLLIVGYLLWNKRPQLQGLACRPSWKGLAALALAGLLAMVGQMVSVAAAVQFSIVLMLFCAVWAVAGDKVARVTLGPLSFLLFAVPFGVGALPVLVDRAAGATGLGLRYTSVPVFQEGRNFVIPSGQWSVIEACGGIRYLLTSVFIGAVFAYLTYTHLYKRALFMVWAVVMPLLANWVRAYVIVMVAHLTNNEWGLGLSHLTLGWVIFGLAIFASFAIGARWRDPLPVVQPQPQGVSSPMAVVLAASLLAAVIPFAWHGMAAAMEGQGDSREPLLRFDSLASLEQDLSATSGIRPEFQGARAVHQASYRYKGEPVDVYVAYYRNQRQGAELVSVFNKLEPSHDWNWSISSHVSRNSPIVPEVRLEGYVKGNRHAAVYHFYWVNGTTTTSDPVSKVLEMISRLRGRGDDAAAITITAYSTDNLEVARLKTEAFAAEHLAGVLADLSRTAVAGL